MTVGDRIKQRRIALKMSQEELARHLGYKSRSSINKIELNQYQLQPDMIKPIADALETTPAYIMGWNEDESGSPPCSGDFDAWEAQHNPGGKLVAEINLIEEIQKQHGKQAADAARMYVQLDKEDQAEIRGEMRGLLKSDKYSIQEESKHA